MKKLALFLLSLGILVTAAPAAVSATSTPASPKATFKTTVKGTVTNNGKPVKNVDITVICKNRAKYAVTDKHGNYSVQYAKGVCPTGETVNVTGSKHRMGGVGSTKVTGPTVTVNLSIVNVSVPEFGLITGFAAAIVGGAGFWYIRRQAA